MNQDGKTLDRQIPQAQVLLASVTARVSVERASTLGWPRFVRRRGEVIGMRTYGASAPLEELQTKLGFTPEAPVTAARTALARRS